MKYTTAILGALLVFVGVGFITLFIGMHIAEERPMAAQALVIGLCMILGGLAAYFSFRATVRR